jgi:hypothetical protein
VGKLSSHHLSSSSDVRFAYPNRHLAWHASGSHLATMQERTCRFAQPKESLVIPISLASPMGLHHFHKSQDTAIVGPSQLPSPQFHAIDENHAWSSIRAPFANGWRRNSVSQAHFQIYTNQIDRGNSLTMLEGVSLIAYLPTIVWPLAVIEQDVGAV